MSLYADYLAETGQRHIIESDMGFATYQISGQECYIVDIYVKPEARKLGQAAFLADKVVEKAKASECKFLSGSVNTSIKDPTSSIKVLLAYGFKFVRSTPEILWFYKEI